MTFFIPFYYNKKNCLLQGSFLFFSVFSQEIKKSIEMLFLDFLPQAIFNSFENHIFGVHRLFLCGCWNSLQRIVNAQILILDFAHSMIRQNIQRLQILQAADKVPQPAQKNVSIAQGERDKVRVTT